MKTAKSHRGLCKLTDTECKFVKSHLIPRALTPPRPGGIAFPQFGGRQRPSRRLDSWYDTALVGQEGEDILTALDTFAISELRRLKLIWQSFGPMLQLSTADFRLIPGTPYGRRRLIFSNPSRMKLFFLSLLWRASATDRPEFAEIKLPTNDLYKLKCAIRENRGNLPNSYFPITLTQISTLGDPHNFSPIAQVKQPLNVGGVTTREMPIFRFFLDGLVAHFHYPVDEEIVECLQPQIVGADEQLIVTTVTWENSWQRENLINTMADAEAEFPERLDRADGLPLAEHDRT